MSNNTCSVPDCQKTHYGKSWCQMHYNRMRKTGSLELRPKTTNYCKVETCGVELVPPYGRGMCQLHYKRFMKHGDPHYERPLIVGVEVCTIDGCDGVIQARGWCSMHWSRWYRYGDPLYRYGYEVKDGKRVCASCKEDKLIDEFGLRATPTSYCMRCNANIAASRRREGLIDQEKNWAYVAARRAQKLTGKSERFSRVEIFERDNWICQICGGPIDRNLKHPDPWHANVDHIIPLSKGGSHSLDNAQASHFRCNLQKGNRVA